MGETNNENILALNMSPQQEFWKKHIKSMNQHLFAVFGYLNVRISTGREKIIIPGMICHYRPGLPQAKSHPKPMLGESQTALHCL